MKRHPESIKELHVAMYNNKCGVVVVKELYVAMFNVKAESIRVKCGLVSVKELYVTFVSHRRRRPYGWLRQRKLTGPRPTPSPSTVHSAGPEVRPGKNALASSPSASQPRTGSSAL